MSSILRKKIECGIQDDQYSRAIAIVSKYMLSNLAKLPKKEKALILPAGKSPFGRLLSRRNIFDEIYILDPNKVDLEFQKDNVKDGLNYFYQINEDYLENIDDIKYIDFILNPFGLQHYPKGSKDFGKKVRKIANKDSLLLTMDWGITEYPEDIKDFPGISNEIEHSLSLQFPPFEEKDGWHLKEEVEFSFFVRRTVDQIAVLLSPKRRKLFKQNFEPFRIIDVSSSIIYRLYEAR